MASPWSAQTAGKRRRGQEAEGATFTFVFEGETKTSTLKPGCGVPTFRVRGTTRIADTLAVSPYRTRSLAQLSPNTLGSPHACCY